MAGFVASQDGEGVVGFFSFLTGSSSTTSQDRAARQPSQGQQGSLMDPLLDPLAPTQPYQTAGKTILGSAAKTGGAAVKSVKNLKSGIQKRKGEEKRYSLITDPNDPNVGNVKTTVRGKDTENVNGFQKELAKDKIEKGIHSGVKTVSSGLKGASKSIESLGPLGVVADNVLDTVDPLKAAGQMVSGTHKMVKGSIDAGRFQKRKGKAREGQEEAQKRNDPLAMGLQNAKRGLSSSRNEAMVNVGLGALETTVGGLGMGQFFDPTGGTAAAHKVLSTVHKGAKKGNLLRRAIKFGQRKEKIDDMRKKADQGDPDAMKWMLENDPRMGSAQMLMHAQTGEQGDRDFAKKQISGTLGLGEDATRELDTGKLTEFDKIYANRTGQDIESGMKVKEAAVYKYVSPWVKGAKKLGNGIKGLFKGKDKGPKTPQLSSNDLADQYTLLTQALESEQAMKKNAPNGQLTSDQMDQAWGSVKGLQPELMPQRGRAEVREYNKVKDFRLKKTHAELIDIAEQKTLGDRVKGKGDGTLFNMDSFTNINDGINKAEDLKLKGKRSTELRKKNAMGPVRNLVKTKLMPDDIRQGVMQLEQERRNQGVQMGNNLPTTAPTGDWKTAQKDVTKTEKEERSQKKEAGTLPGQIAKEQRKAQKKQNEETSKRLADKGWVI